MNRLLLIISLMLLVGCGVKEELPQRFTLSGSGMSPTLEDGNLLLIYPSVYEEQAPNRSDIIVFEYPRDPERHFIKRIIGLPNETIVVEGGIVYVDGVALDEPYIETPPTYQGEWILGADEYFVLGDNRNNSSDSHNWGPLSAENIIGPATKICPTGSVLDCELLPFAQD